MGIAMTINGETLKAWRKRRGLSQQALADRAKLSKRHINRIEAGQADHRQVRGSTVERLARALKVEAEALGLPIDDDNDPHGLLGGIGYRAINLPLGPETHLNFDLIKLHYGVSMEELVEAAPWMFALLAESSLAERRRRIAEARAAFANAMNHVPRHLAASAAEWPDFHEVHEAEIRSISERDIFGTGIVEGSEITPDHVDPFLEFAKKMARASGSDVVSEDPEHFYQVVPPVVV
jgi:transcriptional regulator with XRE-family HTH domain